jgi:uncharacterized repeat protein (TIGR04076 family)
MTPGDPAPGTEPVPPADVPVTALHDLRVVVDRIEGRSVCGHRPGDAFTVTRSSHLRVENGRHFCFYALSCVLPLLAAKQRATDPGDWMTRDSEVACPDPEERLIMRIERGPIAELPTDELT